MRATLFAAALLLPAANVIAQDSTCPGLMRRVMAFQTACCGAATDNCDENGFPAVCSDLCADAFIEFYADCGATLIATAADAIMMRGQFEAMVDDCAHSTGSGHDLSAVFEADHLETCTNIALGKTASSSSTAYGGEPARGIDGGTDGAFSANSCTHTEGSGAQWWQVDLGSAQLIRAVQLTNRVDCCSDRLDGAEVIVSATADYTAAAPDAVCGQVHVTAGNSIEIMSCGDETTAEGAAGQYVTVALTGTLSLCEVAVYAMCDDSEIPSLPPPP